ncbi:PAS domain-containing sensor histidine kinase [Mucilaginibacter psychrotolerans]|uniref:histidine kinase n=1 Tax=Mucilaginibacter psychrotolerans TaxID=1524096 RepID=A0A4Y8RX90_9SPHI|nr:ATP-binding protein [Mucilaginibacter psychrotolerans]TFF30352.1 PAS domain S-box protein [Mucilaginibacter psychrotolerans]
MDTIESLKKENLHLKKENQRLKASGNLAAIENDELITYQASQIRFRTIFETSKLGNKIITPDLKIIDVNPALLALLGYDRNELIGSTILDFSPVEHHQHWQMLQKNLWNRSSPSFTLETCLRRKDGNLIWCNVNSILFEDNNETFGFTIIENITAKREIRLHKDEFINIASHELKTPLTSLKAVIQLFNRILKKDTLITDKVIDLARDAERYVQKLNHLVEDLLNSTRMGEGQLTLNKRRLSLKDILEDCCNHVRLNVNGSHELIHKGDLDVEVFADKHRIDQVLVNFVNNAVKFAPESKEIIIHVDDLNDSVKVSVIDKGKGISAEYVPFLFDRYYCVNENRNQGLGLGLGLYISAEIIRKHDGQIGVDTEAGKGASFWFIIPKNL